MKLSQVIAAVEEQHNVEPLGKMRILSFDPGHTTGWAFFVGDECFASGQIKTDDMAEAPHTVKALFMDYSPDYVICEDYRVYANKRDTHVNNEMLTTRVIGIIETLAAFEFIPVYKTMAVVAKRFVTDKKLKEWDLWKTGERHARDAIRHAIYFIIFRHQFFGGGVNPHKRK